MNRSGGQPTSFEAAPGHLFRADELTDAIAMLLQPMIFGWDDIGAVFSVSIPLITATARSPVAFCSKGWALFPVCRR